MGETPDLADLMTIDQVIRLARERLEPDAYLWAASGAGRGVTTARNAAALNRMALIPRVMRDVGEVDLSTSLLGVPLAIPVMPAPVGALGLYDPGDALAAATAAARKGTAAFSGILGASPWDLVAATAPGRHFFQLYVLGDRAWLEAIVSEVESAGFAGICVTVDTPVIGRRDSSLERGYTWSVPDDGPLARHGFDYRHRARFTWPDLTWLCRQTGLPVIVKGVMTPADAIEAVASGARGVYVSNHGGRVIDHGVSTIEVVGEIVSALAGTAEVVVDGGFTRGSQVCMALALGARAVGIGRLQCWGLAAGGVPGLVRVLEILGEEIANTMANLGCHRVSDLDPTMVRRSISVDTPDP